jgi:hypothetical protein
MIANPDSTTAVTVMAEALLAIDSTCSQCGDDYDLMTAFTEHKVCRLCTRKNHRKAVKQ